MTTRLALFTTVAFALACGGGGPTDEEELAMMCGIAGDVAADDSVAAADAIQEFEDRVVAAGLPVMMKAVIRGTSTMDDVDRQVDVMTVNFPKEQYEIEGWSCSAVNDLYAKAAGS